jgi:hypothetical protein
MKNWNRLTVGVVAVVLAVAAAGGAYAMWGGDGDDDKPSASQNERQADPGDVIGGDGGGVAATCIEGTVDCVDTPLGGEGEGTGLGMCAPGVTDCVDVVVGEDADCAADGPDCGPDILCEYGYEADGCAPAPDCVTEPGIAPDATLAPEEVDRLKAECEEQTGCDDTPGARCLPPDCAVSSDGDISCPQGSGAGNGSTDAGAGEPGSSEGSEGQVDPVEPNAGAPR